MEYLEIRCRGKKKDSLLECRALLGGPSLETLFNHDYTKVPFIDSKFCPECRRIVRMTVTGLHAIPVIETLPKEEKLVFKKPEDVFHFVEVRR